MRPATQERLLAIVSPLALLVLWQVLSWARVLDARFIPSPLTISEGAWALFRSGDLWLHLRASLIRLLAGFVLGAVPGIALGLLMGLSRLARAALDPLVAATYPVPKIAHDPLAIDRTCRPAKIMEVGGSFLEQINVALRESRCPPEISFWFYWNFSHVFYAEGKRRSAPPVQADRLADLAGSDVILLEENELMIGETDHLTALHGLVVSAGRMTSARDAPATR